MSTINSVLSATSSESVQSLTRSIMDGFDTNKDGQFSVEEFSNFLNVFVKSLVGTAQASAGSNTSSTAVGTTPILPSTSPDTTTKANTTNPSSRLNNPLPPCPPGWNGDKWTNLSHTTQKYVAGRVLARYSPSEWVNETTRESILADLKAVGLTPTAIGKDKVDFGDGPVDIVQAASAGGKAWQWCPV